MSSTITIHPAHPNDIPTLAILGLGAFAADPIVGYLARHVPAEKIHAYQCQRDEWRLRHAALSGLRYLKAVDGTGWVCFNFFACFLLVF